MGRVRYDSLEAYDRKIQWGLNVVRLAAERLASQCHFERLVRQYMSPGWHHLAARRTTVLNLFDEPDEVYATQISANTLS